MPNKMLLIGLLAGASLLGAALVERERRIETL